MTELSELAAEAAAKARCTRCGYRMASPSRDTFRMTTGTWRRVGEKGIQHFNLCSKCGPEFRLFLVGYEVAA